MLEQIISKTCQVCKQTKSISEFYRRPDSRDGFRNECKSCRIKYANKYSQTEKGQATQKRRQQTEKRKAYNKNYNKNYRQTEKYKIAHRRSTRHYIIRHPEKNKARYAVKCAIRIGRLPYPDTLQCSHCQNKKAKEYHHHNGYEPEHWLDVVPVCTKCHNAIHD